MPILSRQAAWALVAASAAGFGGGLYAMTGRVRGFNARTHFAHVHVEPQLRREFQLGAYPAVRLTDHEDAAGNAYLRLEYAGNDRLIPVKKPPAKDVPNLGLYDDWAEVLAVNEAETDASGATSAKPGSERLLLVARRTPEGFDPETWGSVRRVEWTFDFYELRPDGTIQEFARRWPRSHRSEERLQRAAESGDERAQAMVAIPVLDERTPEFAAAMHVIPKLNVPRHKFDDTALSPRVLGWTLPVTMLSGVGGMLALAFAAAPRRASANEKPRLSPGSS